MPLNTLNLYLKKGYKQFGIDVKGFDFNTGYYTCVQCKYTNELSLDNLQKAINDFKTGPHAKVSNRFIITTNTDLSSDKFEPKEVKKFNILN